MAWNGGLPMIVGILFLVGLVMAGFPAGGSALTSLTTSFTIDILGGKDQKRTLIHTCMAVLMGITIVVFHALNSTSVIDAVYRLASYTYGPLLGLFTFGLIWKRKVRDGWVPVIAVIAPNGYHFSYELLLMNAAFTIIGLWLAVKPKNQE